jgi:hypothetical protein
MGPIAITGVVRENGYDLVGNAQRLSDILLEAHSSYKVACITYHLNAMVSQPLIELVDSAGISLCVAEEDIRKLPLLWSEEALKDRRSTSVEDLRYEKTAGTGADQTVRNAMSFRGLKLLNGRLQRFIIEVGVIVRRQVVGGWVKPAQRYTDIATCDRPVTRTKHVVTPVRTTEVMFKTLDQDVIHGNSIDY